VLPGDPGFSIPDRLGDSFRHARRHPSGRSIKTRRQTITPKHARAEAGPVAPVLEEGRRRHQPAGMPGLDPADASAKMSRS
jgi:hypothetical protein